MLKFVENNFDLLGNDKFHQNTQLSMFIKFINANKDYLSTYNYLLLQYMIAPPPVTVDTPSLLKEPWRMKTIVDGLFFLFCER